ncbi:hypothetical protein SAMN05443634_103182 [Chishuiella changwenlii]|uniref:Uncharacterized protein n=1 Tax=Chishuiella changwenlii TaxID=1434701 RepID=A0A1M6V4E3_9FLAO|nr:hypothetical protein [Chishuiella changwenlii]GGF01866.1 hypothetical protein GCM10010984_19180 [Chishuiella changwenlii]SHK76264.1 hypothetical protein SAMN05443634_103182 [Chishuiella changwenlii]
MKILFYTIIIASLVSCGASIKTNFSEIKPSISREQSFAFLAEKHKVPAGSVKIGSSQVKDSGFSTDCSYNSNLEKLRKIARDNGANIIKVVNSKGADLWSTCTRMDIDYYYYDGDIKSLQQYRLTLD